MRRILGPLRRASTREPVAAPLRLAFVAGGVDSLVLLTAVDAARRVSGAPSLWTSEPGEDPPWGRRETSVLLSVTAATVAWEALADGRTLGRAVAGIRLERDSGQPLDLRTAVIRAFGGYVIGLVTQQPLRLLMRADPALTWGIAGAVAVARIAARAADPQKRSLEDRVAGTRLVRSYPWWRR